MAKLSKWYAQSLMGIVVGLFVASGVYFVETRPTKKAPIPHFSIANHNAELAFKVQLFGDELRKTEKPNETVVRLVQ